MWVNRKIWPHQLQWLDQNIRRVGFPPTSANYGGKWCIQNGYIKFNLELDSMIIPNMLREEEART